MKIFTNKYFTKNVFSLIQNNISKSHEIMKIDNTIYIPLKINKLNYNNNILCANVHNSMLIPNNFDNYISKFFYLNENNFDLVPIEDNIKLKINIENYYKNILISKEIKHGDIILIEDNDKNLVI